MKREDLDNSKGHHSSLSRKSESLALLPNQNIFKNKLSVNRKGSQLSNPSVRRQYQISKSHNATSNQRFKTENSKVQKTADLVEKRLKTQSTQEFFLGSPFRGSPSVEKKIVTTETKVHNQSNLFLDHDAIDFVEKVEAEKDKGKPEQLQEQTEIRESKKLKQNIRESSQKELSAEQESEERQSKISRSKIGSSGNVIRRESDSSGRYVDDETSYEFEFGDLRSTLGNSRKASFKPVIRSFSHSQKLAMINNNKYTPQTEEEKRMEQRYAKGQQRLVDQVKQIKQLDHLLNQFQRNKKFMVQNSMRKHQIKRIINSKRATTLPSQVQDEGIVKSVSLPRLKPAFQIQLPCPENFKAQKTVEEIRTENGISRVDNNMKKLQHSLSANRFEYDNRKKKLRKNKDTENLCTENEELDNIDSIQRLFNQKGIDYHPSTLRKGLLSVRIKTDIEINDKVEVPKKLVSNPMYKKYPL